MTSSSPGLGPPARPLGASCRCGLNLEHYAESVTRLVLAEPDPHMRRRLQQRVGALRPTAEITGARVEHLPFPDASFDTAVFAQVLCSVPDRRSRSSARSG